MDLDIKHALIHETTILSRLDEMAQWITEDFAGEDLTVVSILNGSLIFTADLLRRISLPLQIDCWSVSSYHGTKSSGQIKFRQHEVADLKNRRVLLLDDIFDSGLTLSTIKRKIEEESGALSVSCCVLLRKDVKRAVDMEIEYVGFDIKNEFVVGYGLDYNEQYRNLPYIGVLNDSAIEKYKIRSCESSEAKG
jgi:hypoxanthine phosphoribosyltransferase